MLRKLVGKNQKLNESDPFVMVTVQRHSEIQAAQTMMADGGNMTPSMMCTTPLEALLSAAVTLLRSLLLGPTLTELPRLKTWSGLPSTVLTDWKDFKSVERTCSGSTW